MYSEMMEEENSNENSNDFENDDEDYDEDVDTYYFESDHAALKGNPDYKTLMKTIIMLESQRIQALKDLDKLHQCQAEAFKDPILFVEKLQSGKDLGFPKRQNVANIPALNWEKYTKNLDFSSLGLPKHMTRLKRQIVDGSSDSEQRPGSSLGMTSSDNQTTIVRGRLKGDKKPATFNMLWNVEEQKRLEDLLLQYPPEEVEAKRWQKIAAALGNRTPLQVASRVQKYFIKLAKAGLPIPGRLPNISLYTKKGGHRHHRFHKFYHQPSTFLQSHEPPVYMSDDESQGMDDQYDDNNSSIPEVNSPDLSDDESVPAELRESDDYRELMRLKSLRMKKLQGKDDNPPQHIGFKCDCCQCEPIVGTRWHCTDCFQEEAVDFCDNCVESDFETKKHNSSHRLKAVQKAENAPLVDKDYTSFLPGDYNYLDSNYLPAN